jgi:hypothetical protein
MTRKDYRITAETIRTNLENAPTPEIAEYVAKLTRQIADDFKWGNSNFRYDKFFETCGLDGWGYVIDPISKD